MERKDKQEIRKVQENMDYIKNQEGERQHKIVATQRKIENLRYPNKGDIKDLIQTMNLAQPRKIELDPLISC